ncbi:hypothetical protein CLAIMM_00102 [Cladophialophora immunda]|nr:hypothetical protein CLAIMM_00102 [Cladophialophora immunda]
MSQAGSTPLNLNFNHLGIAVPDCGEAAKWYAENLGFRVVTALPIYINRDDEPDHPVFDIYPAHLREVKIMVLNMGNNIAFEIFEFIDPKMEHPATFDITRGGMFHFAITHPYPDELCERIIAAGGKKIAMERRDSEDIKAQHQELEVMAADTDQDIDIMDTEKGGSNVTGAPEDEDFEFTFGKFMAMLAFSLGYVSDNFVTQFTGATLGVVNRDIGPSPSYVWMALGQTTGTAALTPIAGRFGDIYGRRNFIILGNVIAMIGTAVAATAKDINTIIVGSVLIGISGAFRQICWSSLGELVPKAWRSFAFGALSSTLSITSSFGPVVAFSFIATSTWRWIYWFPFILDGISLVMTILWYHPMNQYIHEMGTSTWRQILETDFIGCFTFIAGLVVFLLGLSFGGSEFPWRSAGTLAPIVLGFVVLVICAFYEAYSKTKWPIFPPSIFRDVRGFTLVQVAVFLYGMSFYATAVLWPAQVQALYTTPDEPYKIGWYSGASGFAGLVWSITAGIILSKFRHVRLQLIFYVFGVLLFSACQATVTPTSNIGSTILVVFLFAVVAGVNIATITVVQTTVKHEFIGIATGIVCCSRSVGGSIAQVIYTTILHNKLVSNVATDVAAPLVSAGVPPSTLPTILEALLTGISGPLKSLTPSQLLIATEGLKRANAAAFRVVYLVTIAFGTIGLIAVYFVKDIDHLLTQKVDIKLQEGAIIHSHTDTGEGHIIQQNERSA